MSLINDMLKDLESREAKYTTLPAIPLISSESKSNMWIKISISLFFIVGLIVILFHHKKTSSIQPAMSNKSVITTHREDANPADEAWLNPVSITGMTTQVKENITELSFLLDHPALYEFNTNTMQNELTLTVNHSQLQSSLPAISYLNTAIQRITTEVIDQNTVFHLILMPGAFLKFANINTDNNNAELIIDIENSQAKMANKSNTTESSIRSPIVENVLTQQYQQAIQAAEGGNYQSAIQTLSYIVETNPTYHDARTSLVALLIDQGNQTKATQLLDAGLKLNPSYVPFIELKARQLSTAGKISTALSLLQTASPSINDNPDYHAFIAALYERSNKNALAASIYRQLVTQNPNNGSWWFGLGITLEKLGHAKEASNAYSTAMAKGNLNAESMAYLQTHLQTLKENLNATE